eukprot:jgi/Ulvmu1/3725/UM172_0003.1
MGWADVSSSRGDDTVVVEVVSSAAPTPTGWGASASRKLKTRISGHLIVPLKHLSAGDVSGSLGDLGTFLPLTVALVNTVGLDLGTTLVFSGLYNLYSGAAFGVPIPVQPMKSIAAVAITEDGITLEQTLLAGVLVSTVVFVLGVTKLIDAGNRLVHDSVIRGIQVGIGLKLAIKGADMVMFTEQGGPWRPWLGAHGLILGIVAAVYVLFAVVKYQPGGAATGGDACCDAAESPAANPVATAHARCAFDAQPSRLQEDGSDAVAGSPACDPDERYSNAPSHMDAVLRQTDAARVAAVGSSSCNGARPPTDKTGHPQATSTGHARQSADAARAAVLCGGAADSASEPDSSAQVELQGSSGGDGWSGSIGNARPGLGHPRAPHPARRSSMHIHRCRDACGRVARAAAAFPPALLLVLVGVGVTLVDTPGVLGALAFGPATPKILRPVPADWWPAFTRAALPQLPLTLLNSVIAVTLLSRELFPAVPLTMPHVAASVGVMNAVGPWFGCMPCCHGAGGLAAQARFGARSGAAPMLLGSVKLTAGLAAGSSMLPLLRAFPQPLLGVLLVFSGGELATTASKLSQDKRYWLLMMITAATAMAKDTGLGFIVGLLSTWLVKDRKWPWQPASPSG